ncbi:hypothetical protein ASE74_16350 [Pedobacter sp. Leaf216]|nr:hypothetical protein ASE74_16350 [Pedobacter sp. Leaf216]
MKLEIEVTLKPKRPGIRLNKRKPALSCKEYLGRDINAPIKIIREDILNLKPFLVIRYSRIW